jgi:hypothetical protein
MSLRFPCVARSRVPHSRWPSDAFARIGCDRDDAPETKATHERDDGAGARAAARVLLISERNLLLLLHADDSLGGHRWWLAPGGMSLEA